MNPDQLRDHNLRNIAGGLRDVMRRRHPDLTFDIGVVDRNGFRRFPSRSRQTLGFEPTGHKPESGPVPHPDNTKEAA